MTSSIILDLDGTLLHEHVALPDAVATVRAWVERGHRISYATNDAVLTCEEQQARLEAAGFPLESRHGTVPLATAATVTASVIRARHTGGQAPRVLLVGAPAVAVALAGSADLVDERPNVVVVGLDMRLTYERLAVAVDAVGRGARLLATNADPWFVSADGRRMPGAGAVVAAIERATEVEAEVLGKPGTALYEAVLDPAASPVVVVGDTATDLVAGRAIGATCLAVGACAGHPLAHSSAPGIGALVDHPLVGVLDVEEVLA